MSQQIIELDEVVKDFKNLINTWCLQHSTLHNIPKYQMCALAVEKFGHVFSKDHIRKNIDPEFKIHWRVKNGQRSWTKRTAEKTSVISSSFSNSLVQGTIHSRK